MIGDKTAWYTALVFRDLSEDSVKQLIYNIEKDYKVKVKFIHLIRNPFDIVSTITLRQTHQQKGARFADHSEKVRLLLFEQLKVIFIGHPNSS